MRLEEFEKEVEKRGWTLKINNRLKTTAWRVSYKHKTVSIRPTWDDYPTKNKAWAAEILKNIDPALMSWIYHPADGSASFSGDNSYIHHHEDEELKKRIVEHLGPTITDTGGVIEILAGNLKIGSFQVEPNDYESYIAT